MRLRATVLAAALASTSFVALATSADAVTTTSTTVVYLADINADGNGELYRRAADGSGSPTLVHSSVNDIWLPALSPDGTLVAYLEDRSSVEDYDYRLFVRPTDGTGTATLLSAGDVLSPSWSRDGTTVVYSKYDWATDAMGVYTVPATGGTPTLVPTTDQVYADEPMLSPSGRQVAVTTYTATSTRIDVVTLGSGTRAALAGTTGGSDPVWSPDGQYLLFQREIGCGWGLFRIPAGGGTAVPIRVREGYFAGSAEYSEDGTQLFWSEVRQISCNPGAKAGELWLANADGTSPAQVTATAGIVEYGLSVAGGTTLPLETTPPAAPVIGAAGTVGATTAKISWTAEGDATEFVVLRKPNGDPAPTSLTDGTLVYQGAARSATASGLTTGTAYDFYVFAIDASGNESPVSAVHSARPTPTPVLKAIPQVGVATAGTSFPVSWTGSANGYQVNVGQKTRSSSGVWSTSPAYKTLVASTTSKSLVFNGAQAKTYYFQVRGLDDFGNATAYTAAKTAIVPLDERYSGFTYSTGWTNASSAARYLGTYKYTTGTSKTMTGRFDTSSFAIIGDRCSSCGAFKVYVDGVLKATIDTHAMSTKTRQVLYQGGNFSKISPHTIKIVTVGTARRPRVDIDGIALRR